MLPQWYNDPRPMIPSLLAKILLGLWQGFSKVHNVLFHFVLSGQIFILLVIGVLALLIALNNRTTNSLMSLGMIPARLKLVWPIRQ